MNSLDSVTKVVTQYFAAVTKEPFTYQGKSFEPKNLRVSPGIFTRTMVCVADCGGCCKKLTVDFLPGEDLHVDFRKHAKKHEFEFNGKTIFVNRDDQSENGGYFCRYLNHDNARCGIHGQHPFSCDFELLRFSMMSAPARPNQLTHRPFGRGWNMRLVDESRGALCEWNDAPEGDPAHQADVVRKLKRLKDWTDYFGIETCLPEIIEWVETGPHKEPLICQNKET